MSAALQAAEKLPSFVGRAFRHDIKSAISSGVLTPGGLKAHSSATSLAAEVLLLQFSQRILKVVGAIRPRSVVSSNLAGFNSTPRPNLRKWNPRVC
jgi:hypothetical protein